jgi:hypothetical protein
LITTQTSANSLRTAATLTTANNLSSTATMSANKQTPSLH